MKKTTQSYQKLPFRLAAFTLIFISAACLNTGCKKFVEVATPPNQIVSSLIFTNDATATSAISGIYAQLVVNNLYFMNGAMTAEGGLSADELVNTTPSTTLDPFSQNTLASNNGTVQTTFWKAAYGYIYQANACIEGLNKSTGLTPAVKSQLLGEAKFVRALNYFYMVNLFGNVPLITGTDYTINEIAPRTATTDDVYTQMIVDLTDAQQLLLPAYPSAGPVRANKWAATALLARVYLYHKDYTQAEAQATAVINSGTYSLVPSLAGVFLAGSKEAILQFIPAPGNNTAEGLAFIPSSATARPTYALTSTLLAAFEPNDSRKTTWLGNNVISGVTYYYPFKYKVRSNTVITENYMVLRLAEQYLIRAEARAQQQNFTGAAADINIIRARAGLAATPAATQSTLLAAVQQERRIELFAEWGHRWLDLKRTGTVDAVLSAAKTGWQPYQALYPIPFLEIQRNPALTQNPGYQ